MAKPFKLRNGTLMISTEAPGGIYNSAQLKTIMSLCDAHGAVVKATEDQRLALFVPEAAVVPVTGGLKAVGLALRHYQDGLHQPISCVGELCSEHQQDALGTAMDVTSQLAGIAMSNSMRIGINGCAQTCVPTHTLDISVVGEANGYRVSIGGKNTQIPEMATFLAEGVPAAELPSRIRKIVEIFKAGCEPDETLQAMLERVGLRDFIAALAPYSQDAAGGGDSLGSADDLGASSPFGGEAPAGDETFDEGGDDVVIGDDVAMEDIDPQSGSGAGDHLSSDILIADELDPVDGLVDASGDGELEHELIDEEIESIDADKLPVPLDDGMTDADALIDEDEGSQAHDDAKTIIHDDTDSVAAATNAASRDDVAREMARASVPPPPVQMSGSSPAASAASTPKAPEPPPAESSTSDLDAQSAGEDEESAFEAKLNESIAETEAIPVDEDANAEDRLAAVAMIESGEDAPAHNAAEAALAGIDDSESVGSVDELAPEMMADDEILDDDSSAHTAVAAVEESAIGATEAHGISAAEALEAVPVITPAAGVRPSPRISNASVHASTRGGNEFSGVVALEGGKWALTFASGARIGFDPSRFASNKKSFSAFGQQFDITRTANGISVEVDGIEMSIPNAA